jgi:hypothetical protein
MGGSEMLGLSTQPTALLRSWLRLHHGISQAHLPIYLGFF